MSIGPKPKLSELSMHVLRALKPDAIVGVPYLVVVPWVGSSIKNEQAIRVRYVRMAEDLNAIYFCHVAKNEGSPLFDYFEVGGNTRDFVVSLDNVETAYVDLKGRTLIQINERGWTALRSVAPHA